MNLYCKISALRNYNNYFNKDFYQEAMVLLSLYYVTHDPINKSYD